MLGIVCDKYSSMLYVNIQARSEYGMHLKHADGIKHGAVSILDTIDQRTALTAPRSMPSDTISSLPHLDHLASSLCRLQHRQHQQQHQQ